MRLSSSCAEGMATSRLGVEGRGVEVEEAEGVVGPSSRPQPSGTPRTGRSEIITKSLLILNGEFIRWMLNT